MPEEDIQRKLYQFEALRSRVESLTQTKQLLQSEVGEIEETQNSLKEIEKLDEGEEVFFPLGSGSYGFGKLTDNEKVLVNVGGNAIVKGDTSKAGDILERKKEEFKEQISEIDETIERVQKKLQRLQLEIQKASG